MYEMEATHWWFRHLHALLLQLLVSLGAGSDARILDAGCGTGQILQNLSEQISKHVYGFDLSLDARAFWQKRRLSLVCNASVNRIAYADNAFDFVVCIDVLESREVIEQQAVIELLRVTRTGGYLCLVVPAYDWLMTPEHHQAVHAVRRYTKKRVHAFLSNFPGQEINLTHLFMPVFPAVAIYRLLLRARPQQVQKPPRSELRQLPGWMNESLRILVGLERPLLKWLNLPFGSSILVVFQKQE